MPVLTPHRLVEENLRHAMSVYAHSDARGHVQTFPGVYVVSCGRNFGAFNTAHLIDPVGDDLPQRINAAAEHFLRLGQRWSFWLADELLDRTARRQAKSEFLRHGLRRFTEPPGMFADRLQPPARPGADLDIRPVQTLADRLVFCDITSIVFDVPFPISRQIYEGEGPWRNGFRGWIGYWRGKPVTSAATVAAGGVIGLYCVGTLPQHQRLGLGEATVRWALDRARDETGIGQYILQTTPAGLPLYERLGFRRVMQFGVYIGG